MVALQLPPTSEPKHAGAEVQVSQEVSGKPGVGDGAAVEHVDSVGERQREVEVVLDHQDGGRPLRLDTA
jgi:hypothetical protein